MDCTLLIFTNKTVQRRISYLHVQPTFSIHFYPDSRYPASGKHLRLAAFFLAFVSFCLANLKLFTLSRQRLYRPVYKASLLVLVKNGLYSIYFFLKNCLTVNDFIALTAYLLRSFHLYRAVCIANHSILVNIRISLYLYFSNKLFNYE